MEQIFSFSFFTSIILRYLGIVFIRGIQLVLHGGGDCPLSFRVSFIHTNLFSYLGGGKVELEM